MNQTPAAQAPSPKRMLLSVLVLLLLTGLIVFVFKDNWAEISAALGRLSVWQVLAVLALGFMFPFMDGVAFWLVMRSRLPDFKLRQGVNVAFIGSFCNVVTFGAGTIPMRTYYLCRCGADAGSAVGLMTLEYVTHKATVLLYATVMLLFQHEWLLANTTGLLTYLPAAYAMVAAIIIALVLVCVSPLVQSLARWLLHFLPKSEKWQSRRASWLEQLDNLSAESRHLLQNKARCVELFAAHALKLLMLYALPYMCIRFMGLSDLTFWQVQLLTSLMMFLSNALPNVAGMGSIETAFLLVFSGFLGQAGAMSTLMLYRIGTYYFVFVCGAVVFFAVQNKLTKQEKL